MPAASIDEPHIDPYDFGFDDVGYGLDTREGTRIDGRGVGRAGSDVDHQPEFVELIELDDHRVDRPGDPISNLVGRLGLGAIDPLLLRLGVIVLIGVLLAPLAMALRPGSSNGSVQTETTPAPSTELIASGAAPVVEDPPAVDDTAPSLGAGSGDESAPGTQPSDEPAATPSPSVEPAAATAQTETPVNEGDVTESAGDSGSGVAATVRAPQAMAKVATEPADATEAAEPAQVAAPECQLSYTVSAGDYWIRVADTAGIGLAKLLRANLATVATPLYPGDDICLPDGATIPSPPSTTTTPPATTAPPPTITPRTTVAPTTTAPVVTSPPLAPGEVEDIIRAVWPDDLEGKALEIAWRESGYRTSARNSCCYGLFQIHWTAHSSWLENHGVTSPTQLLDADANVRIAYALYQRSGWGPWDG